MDIKKTVEIISKLGSEFISLSQDIEKSIYANLIQKAVNQNKWFTNYSIQMAFELLGTALHCSKILQWLSNYNLVSPVAPKTIGIVMAGNIPLVGFHDLLCVLVSGNVVLAKLSSKDQALYSIVKLMLEKIDPEIASRIKYTEATLTNIDAIIATGSNNSARYFEYYFSKYPHIIRKNRNSAAIITGNESMQELQNLSHDIFTYFGLGCRNVSFLLTPENYNFDSLFKAFNIYSSIAEHSGYANNYDYQKAILLMNSIPFFDNGFCLLKADDSLASAISVIHYMTYNTENDAEKYIETNKHKIQCVVSKTKWPFPTYGLGKAQNPELCDYADNVDTLAFLLSLK